MKAKNIYSENEIVNTMINDLDEVIFTMVKTLRINRGCMMSHNNIIEVGPYTIGAENGEAKLKLTNRPSQWDVDGVNSILKIEFKNGSNEVVIPKVFKYKDWYKKEIRKSWEIRKDLLTRSKNI
jgi:hypothetical protein